MPISHLRPSVTLSLKTRFDRANLPAMHSVNIDVYHSRMCPLTRSDLAPYTAEIFTFLSMSTFNETNPKLSNHVAHHPCVVGAR